jgi:hypothetical protein
MPDDPFRLSYGKAVGWYQSHAPPPGGRRGLHLGSWLMIGQHAYPIMEPLPEGHSWRFQRATGLVCGHGRWDTANSPLWPSPEFPDTCLDEALTPLQTPH